MAIDFPASPSFGQTFVVGTVTYTWDGVKWTAVAAGGGGGGSGDKIEEGNTSAEVIDTGSDGRFVVTTEGSEALRVDKSGKLLVGTSSTYTDVVNSAGGYSGPLWAATTGSANCAYFLSSWSSDAAVDGLGTSIILSRSKNGTIGSHTALASGNAIGTISFNGSDGSKFVSGAVIRAEVDGNPGANDMPGRLVFSTTADGASTPTARFRIDNQGRQSMFAADYVLNLRSASAASGSIEALYVARSATTLDNGTGVFAVYTNGTYATLSDQTQKKNIETTRDGYLDDINKLRVVKYNWNEQEDNEPKELGLIAQEVEQVFPGLINEMRSEEGELPKKGVKAGVLPYMLIKALQEATARIETLEAKVAALESA